LSFIVCASIISNASIMKFTMTILNGFDQYNQWWIYVGMQVSFY